MKRDGIQLRGHCMHCGREQAVTKGLLADHGYTLADHWRSGTCSGAREVPMQGNPLLAAEVVDELRRLADKRAAKVWSTPGAVLVELCEDGVISREMMLWGTLTLQGQRSYRARWEAERLGLVGQIRSTANRLATIGAAVCGLPLTEVLRKADPVPVRPGDRKVADAYRVLTARFQDRGRVYWRNEASAGTGWLGVQAWRKLVDAPGGGA